MKTLNFEQLIFNSGSGRWGDFIEGGCIAAAGLGAGAYLGLFSNPISAGGTVAIGVGCAVNSIASRIWNY